MKLSTLRNKCDKLLQEYYVPKNPQCYVCGGKTSEMHHFIPKSQSRYLRYHIDNLVPLCKGCHFAHHTKGDTSVGAKIGFIKGEKWFDDLQLKRRIIQKENKEFYTNIITKLEDK